MLGIIPGLLVHPWPCPDDDSARSTVHLTSIDNPLIGGAYFLASRRAMTLPFVLIPHFIK